MAGFYNSVICDIYSHPCICGLKALIVMHRQLRFYLFNDFDDD